MLLSTNDLSGILGFEIFGQPVWRTPISIFSADLSGIVGVDFFGQPLWKTPISGYQHNSSYSLLGNALITSTTILPNHGSVNITGNAVIKR